MSDTAQAHNVDSAVSAAGEPQLHVAHVPPQVGVIAQALGEIAADLQRLADTDATSTAGYFVRSAATNMRGISEALASGEFPDQAAAHVMSAAAWCGTFVGSASAAEPVAKHQTVDVRHDSTGAVDRPDDDTQVSADAHGAVDVRGNVDEPRDLAEPVEQSEQSGDVARNIATAGAAAAAAGAFVPHTTPAHATGSDDVLGSEYDHAEATPTSADGHDADLETLAGTNHEAAASGPEPTSLAASVDADSAAGHDTDSWPGLRRDLAASTATEPSLASDETSADLASGVADRSSSTTADGLISDDDARPGEVSPDQADPGAAAVATPTAASAALDEQPPVGTVDSADRLAAVTNSHTLVHTPIADDESGLVIDAADEADATELRAYEAAFGPVTESGPADDSGAQAGALAAAFDRNRATEADDLLPSAESETSQPRPGAAASVAFGAAAATSDAVRDDQSASAHVPAPEFGSDQSATEAASAVSETAATHGETASASDEAADVAYTEDDSWLQDTVDIQAMAKKAPADTNLAQAIAATANLTGGPEQQPLAAPSGEPVAHTFARPPQPALATDLYDRDHDTTEPGASAYVINAGSTGSSGSLSTATPSGTTPTSDEVTSGSAATQDSGLTDGPTIAMSADTVRQDPHTSYDESRTTHILQNPESAEVFGDLNSTRIMTPPEAESMDFSYVDGEQSKPVAGLGQDTVPMTKTTQQQLSEQHLVDQGWQNRPTEVVSSEQNAPTRRMHDGPFAETVQSAVPESTWMNSDTIDHKSFQAQVAARPVGDDAPTVAIPTNFAAANPAAVDEDSYDEDRRTTVTPPAVVEQLKRAREAAVAAEAEGTKRRGNLPWGGAPGH